MSECKLLDTTAFIEFLDKKSSVISDYNNLTKEYDRIIDKLSENWKGQGATAFFSDAEKVKTNIASLGDVLQTMCDTLQGCLDIFNECDHSLGELNRRTLEK